MTSSASRSEGGLSPELHAAARDAARRAGMTVDEWMRAAISDLPAPRSGYGPVGGRLAGRRPAASTPHEEAAIQNATRLADTVARLNDRLDQLTAGRASVGEMDERLGAVRGELESLRRQHA